MKETLNIRNGDQEHAYGYASDGDEETDAARFNNQRVEGGKLSPLPRHALIPSRQPYNYRSDHGLT